MPPGKQNFSMGGQHVITPWQARKKKNILGRSKVKKKTKAVKRGE